MKTALKLVALVISICVNAQIKDLAEISSGEMVNFQAITPENEGNFFGYFTLYNLGDASKTSKKFEYVILYQL